MGEEFLGGKDPNKILGNRYADHNIAENAVRYTWYTSLDSEEIKNGDSFLTLDEMIQAKEKVLRESSNITMIQYNEEYINPKGIFIKFYLDYIAAESDRQISIKFNCGLPHNNPVYCMTFIAPDQERIQKLAERFELPYNIEQLVE